MASVVIIVGIVLSIGWVVWWWLLRGHTSQTSALVKRVEELEQRHEPK